jgi:hypothetical protein
MSELPKYRVGIGIPYYRSVEGPTLLSAMDLSARSASAGNIGMLPIGTSGCYIEDNRNGCIEYAINTKIDFTHFLWIDGDMTFPGDALVRLLAHDKDIVGANYRLRTPPYEHAGVYKDRGTDLLAPGLHEMEQMPTGLLLTKFDIYRKMGYPWFAPGLHSQPRDDIYFCRKAKEMGYTIWCDHDLTKEVTHTGVQTIAWFMPEQLVKVVEGAQIDLQRSAIEAQERAKRSHEGFKTATTGRSAA